MSADQSLENPAITASNIEGPFEDDSSRQGMSSEAAMKSDIRRFMHRRTRDDKPTVATSESSVLKRPSAAVAEEDHADEGYSLSPTKKRRKSSKYAPPSTYAHLKKLTDIIEPDLIGIFVGFNPGVTTATAGHAYAHPSNQFWKLLHSSGLTDVRLKPQQDVDLPRLYQMGNTNLVDRPSNNLGELSKAEMAAGTPNLEEKIRQFRPESVCIVGKGIWEAI